jgi:hypothetical protein
VSAIRRHRQGAGHHEVASDEELDRAFGLDRPPIPKHNDLLLIRRKDSGATIGDGAILVRYSDQPDMGDPHCQFFGTEYTCRLDEVELVQVVTQVWV